MFVAAVVLVVAPRMAQIDAAGERDVAFGCRRVPDHHQLLMVRTTEPNPLIEKHLAARLLDGLTEVPVLLFAVLQLVQV